MQISNIKKLTTTFAKKFNHEFLPNSRERVSLLIGNFNCCSIDTVKFYC